MAAILNVVLRGRRPVALAGVVVAALLIGTALLGSREWTAKSAFMPQTRRNQGNNLSGLAAQFGLSIGSEMSSPVGLYADLMKSRAILGSVARRTFSRTLDGRTLNGTLDVVMETKGLSPELRRERAIDDLARDTRVVPDLKTGIIRVEVDAPEAALSQTIATAMLDELNRFNLETRQSQATAERKFTERRRDEAREDLRESEQRLEQFLKTNRDYRNSPQLLFQYQRLDRDVQFKQQLYTTFAQAFEQAKVDEVRDTPVITLVEAPELPLLPKRRYLIVKGAAGLAVGMILAILALLVKDWMSPSLAGGDAERTTTRELWRETLHDLRHPVRALRGTPRGGS